MSKGDKTKESLVFGLDIGTRAVVGVVGYRSNDTFIVKAIESVEHETRAMIDGQIHDIAKVAATIVIVKEKLEKKCKISLKNVCIAAAGRVLKTEKIRAEIEFDNEQIIEEDDIFDLQQKGVELAYKTFNDDTESLDKYYCVGKSVVKYYMNDLFISNLINHKAKKIAAEMICTFLPYDVVDGLYKAVEIAGLEVCNLTLEPIAAIEVAIPEKFRMLNIALVDVGAGTSDICITKDGSVIAYGMIPLAGDSFTELIANYCMCEFNEAEKIKKSIESNDETEYEDIIGFTNVIKKEEILSLLEPKLKEMTGLISDEIIRLNGGNKVGAIFVVGGGGKIEGFTETLAGIHDIMVNRVAIRGEEVMNKIEFEDSSVIKDSLIVTPLGICLHFYEENNSFINVSLNDDRLKLYDNGKLTVVDAIMQIGLDNNVLFPRRGDSLVFTLNDEEKVIKGELGDACVVYLNNDVSNLHAPLRSNDYINLVPSTKGPKGRTNIAKLKSNNQKLNLTVNGMNVTLPNLCTVNGDIKVDSYEIQDNDTVEMLDYLSVNQVLELLDLSVAEDEEIYVNNAVADGNTKVYSRFEINISKKKEISFKDLPDEVQETSDESEEISHNEESVEETNKENFKEIEVVVNNSLICLKGKSEYVFVDVFDYIDFDLSTPRGGGIETLLNGKRAEFLEKLKDGDVIDIFWKDLE